MTQKRKVFLIIFGLFGGILFTCAAVATLIDEADHTS